MASKRTLSDIEKEDGGTRKKVLKFRNYNPHTEDLKEKKLKRTMPESIENQVSEQIEAGGHSQVEEVNLSNLAPKKANWDLKRDTASKLEILERRTQKAIIELIRERLKEDGEGLASAVAAQGEEYGHDDDTQD
ncbi:PREDICTED: coiled-coil domain-containing protein 12-like [Amphimedon queenslandica]|uniref:Coiled-coil domain-containing protein 12 n=1 Tax=Amphimedon queenslandica TaxID=400682 RepID=A0A1X7VBZ6_AMPQE|nr:PREDICTED: coiled-coil domain-containing protein 12-like [Amphimedon queenslandica]|eukprot:XP_003384885.1 PREDICTED: coiled-coil domain-containing protein 12-like [Amphimedon queenslandica]